MYVIKFLKKFRDHNIYHTKINILLIALIIFKNYFHITSCSFNKQQIYKIPFCASAEPARSKCVRKPVVLINRPSTCVLVQSYESTRTSSFEGNYSNHHRLTTLEPSLQRHIVISKQFFSRSEYVVYCDDKLIKKLSFYTSKFI